jgi:hypothetical protein
MKSKDLLSLTRNTSPDDLTSSTSRQTGCRCMFRRAICGGALKERFGCLGQLFGANRPKLRLYFSRRARSESETRRAAKCPRVAGSSVITSGPFGLTGNDGLVGDSFVCIARTGSGYPAAFQVTLSRENDTTPYFSPEYTPVKPSGCAAACCSVQVSLPIEDKSLFGFQPSLFVPVKLNRTLSLQPRANLAQA